MTNAGGMETKIEYKKLQRVSNTDSEKDKDESAATSSSCVSYGFGCPIEAIEYIHTNETQ